MASSIQHSPKCPGFPEPRHLRVSDCHRAAGEDRSGLALLGGQGEACVVQVIDLAVQEARLAPPAATGLAAVRVVDPGVQRRGQDGLSIRDGDGPANVEKGNVRHFEYSGVEGEGLQSGQDPVTFSRSSILGFWSSNVP